MTTLILVVGDHETGGMGLGMDTMGYRLNLGTLMATRVSVEDTLAYGAGQYKKDRAAYLSFLANEFGLTDLNENETAQLNKAMDYADAGKTAGYYKINPAALTASHILSQRANINWTTTIHTATMIPLSATGSGAGVFSGFRIIRKLHSPWQPFLDFVYNRHGRNRIYEKVRPHHFVIASSGRSGCLLWLLVGPRLPPLTRGEYK